MGVSLLAKVSLLSEPMTANTRKLEQTQIKRHLAALLPWNEDGHLCISVVVSSDVGRMVAWQMTQAMWRRLAVAWKRGL